MRNRTPEGGGASGLAEPRPFTGALALLAVPGLARQFAPIPARYFATVDEATRVVHCPCGRRPTLGLGELRSCEHARQWVPDHAPRGGCSRTFIATNRAVLVTGTPA